MSIKSSKEIQKQNLRKAYFDYWRIQNNPKYIKFWKKAKSLGHKAFEKYIYDPPMKKNETYPEWFMRTQAVGKGKMESWLVKEMKRFGVWTPLPDPYKKIDWINFEENPDPEIIESMNNAYAYNAHLRKRFPIMIDPLLDDYEIHDHVDRYVKFLRAWIKTGGIIKPARRDRFKEYPLYAQIWDLRKGYSKKTFKQVGSELKEPIQTVVSRFKRAYELLYNKPYKSQDYKNKIREIVKRKTCKNCPERISCQDPCPDVIFELDMVEGKQQEKLDGTFYDLRGEKKSIFEIRSDREVYRIYQQQNRKG